MDEVLGLNLSGPRTRGRPPKPIEATLGRELTAADIEMLSVDRGVKPQAVARLRDSHHALARCLASGMKPADAALATGYSVSRISILQSDPAFADLLRHYRAGDQLIQSDIAARYQTMSLDALEILRERMLDEPDSFRPELLLEISKVWADRTGHGPQTKNQNLNVNIDLAARLESARRREEQELGPARSVSPPLIEATAKEESVA